MSKNLDKLKKILSEMFQMDQADLDFGIYRIMNQKRGEINLFLDKDLLPQVKKAFQKYSEVDRSAIQKEIEQIGAELDKLGVIKENSDKYLKLLEKLNGAVDVTGLEEEVYSHLTDFFRRYYNNGDFLSLQRYKDNVYSIPYQGEEVKLHWANADQYYIKTTEYFRDYAFTLPDGKKVHFKLIDASTEENNNKTAKDNERRFVLCEEYQAVEEDGKLFIHFKYRMDKSTQTTLNEEAVSFLKLYITEKFKEKYTQLFSLAPTEKKPGRTLLEKRLNDYTARNTFDYFIHKDLGGFLRRELDFYIKNEMMHLDDLNTEKEYRIEQYIAKIKVVKEIGHKIIAFLEHIENFQKKLWLKKKFLVASNYCLTLDRVPIELYPEIVSNQKQINEWKKLLTIDEIQPTDDKQVFIETVELLRNNPYLVLNTELFNCDFKERLLATVDNLDENTDGLLIHSENFQTENLLINKYKGQIKCIYIDPPYNKEAEDGFIYKDNYQESSWLALMADRLVLARDLLTCDGTLAISIDLKEINNIIQLCDIVFGGGNRKAIITVKRGSVTGPKVINPGVVNVTEYIIIYSKNTGKWKPNMVLRQKERDPRYSGYIVNRDKSPDEWKFKSLLDAFSQYMKIGKRKLKTELGQSYDELLNKFVIENANSVYQPANLDETKISNYAKSIKKESISTPNKVYILKREGYDDWYIKNGKRILIYSDRLTKIGNELVQGEIVTDIWDDVLPNDIHNEGGVSLRKGKKPEKLIHRIFQLTTNKNDLVMDFFAGSGTSCAVAQKMGLKWIGVEMGYFFDKLTLSRLKNTLNGEHSGISNELNWSGGGFFQYIRLESYEDAINNLELKPAPIQQLNFDLPENVRERYMLSYMLDVETRDSTSLLNIDAFTNPFAYKMKISRDGEEKIVDIDLIDTFNYLLGLKVDHLDKTESFTAVPDKKAEKPGALRLRPCKGQPGEFSFRQVTGTTRTGDKALIIWRVLTGNMAMDNASLDAYFTMKGYNPRDLEFSRIYVNGDNNLANLKADEIGNWKVMLIEEEFKRLMFDVRDI